LIKLKEIITNLNNTSYEDFEQQLSRTKADKFLFLTKAYRSGDLDDDEILKQLDLNSNSFYVLKSRLYDKLKSHLTEDISIVKEDILNKLQKIYSICYNQPREISIPFLEKLEEELLKYDMHSELLVVYSFLKKMHLKSEQYFYYSQLYNKHIAFWLSLEKSEALLGNFNQLLCLYVFSKSDEYLNRLMFLKSEVANHLVLNPSRPIEIISNIVNIELFLFCGPETVKDLDIEKTINETALKINELPDSSHIKQWEIAMDFLSFEYYRRMNPVKAMTSYQKLNSGLENLLLYNNICLTPEFLLAKIRFLCDKGELETLIKEGHNGILIDPNDTYSKVIIGIYRSMISYYEGKTKDAISILNEVINLYSFKDFFHINIEVKLTLAFFYIKAKDFDMADNLIKSIYRKIKTEKLDHYENVLDVIKVLNFEMQPDSKAAASKKKDAFTLFCARNPGKYAVLEFLIPELKKI
jgi:hypothetical protein